MLGADRRNGAGSHIRDPAGIEDRLRRAGARIEQREDGKLGGKTELVVIDEIANDLDARGIDRRLDGTAQHVEVPVGDARFEMHAGLDHGFATALTGQARFNRRKDLVVGDLKFIDVETVQIGDIDGRQG